MHVNIQKFQLQTNGHSMYEVEGMTFEVRPMLFEGNERKQREQQMKQEGRLPPGQSLTLKWPVLHYGSVPRFDPETWDFRVYGLVQTPLKLTWDEFNALPKADRASDFHCVTRWSRFDNRWNGVPFREVLRRVQPWQRLRTSSSTPNRDLRPMSRFQTWIGMKSYWSLTTMVSRSRPITAILCACSSLTYTPGNP
jgi:hypothetical protein